MAEYFGHMTMADGSHVPLSGADAAAIWNSAMSAKAWRELVMPDTRDALNTMFDAFARLKDLGWREAMYCPKDGTHFEAITAGSTGTFECWYDGQWPTGRWWGVDGGDIWPMDPILFRLYPADQAKYDERMAEARRQYARERMGLPHA